MRAAVAAWGVLVLLSLVGCRGRTQAALVTGDYTQWERTTPEPLRYPIPGHLDNLRIVYVNELGRTPEVRQVDGRTTYAYPPGTVFVKEVYEGIDPPDGAPPGALTIMVKAPEHPSAVRGWVWLIKDPVGGEEHVVTEEFCAVCHAEANHPHPYGDGNPADEYRDCVFLPYGLGEAR